MGNILLIKTHAFGDVLLTTPAIRAIYKNNPKNKIYYFTCKWSSDALYNNPYITKTFVLDDDALFGKKLYKILPLIIKLRKYKFESIIIFSASKFIHFLSWLIGAPNRVGFGNSSLITHKVDPVVLQSYYAAEAYNKLLEPLSIQNNGTKLDFQTKEVCLPENLSNFLKKYNMNIIGLFCGGGKNPRDTVLLKQWGAKKFIELAKLLSADGYGFLLFGSKDDCKVNTTVKNELLDSAFDLSGQYSPNETGYLMKMCSLFITNDSAPFHISYALTIPTVCIFGPSNSKLLSPQLPFCKHIQSRADCSPCYGNDIFRGCTNPVCMESISAESVYKECKSLLSKNFN
ncbi:MAG: glycosyltransferase family 9 protein [Candidatus Kuenenia sp.]|nr:glycosyltransferase family 9 protein [Candidatus Kuenenia hertensis]